METQAEYNVSSDSDMPMHAYVIALHLVSQGYSDFTELKELLCLDYYGNYYANVLARIIRKMEQLEEEWGESIPPITALVSRQTARRPNGFAKRSLAMDRHNRQRNRSRSSLHPSPRMTDGMKF